MTHLDEQWRYERLAMPAVLLSLTLLLLVPVVTARRSAASYAELARASAARRALLDVQQGVSAKSDSAAAMLDSTTRRLGAPTRATVDTVLSRFTESKRDTSRQAALLAASDVADSALELAEQQSLDRMTVIRQQGDGVGVFLIGATVIVSLAMAWLLRRLRLVTAELESRVKSETSARAEADRALAQRDQVLRIVSHDLKNPLHTIQMATAIAGDEQFPEASRRRQFEVIGRSIDRMRRLVGDLLDAARLESGHSLAITPVPMDLRTVLSEARDQFSELAARKAVSLQVDVPATELPVLADRGRVLQVLSNLMDNAMKFVPRNGDVRVRVDASAGEVEDGRVRVSVTNTGPAIPADVLPTLFKPFSQARDTAVLGTGLGLSIAKGIVEAHGGIITVDSGQDGTTFAFTLPEAPEDETDYAAFFGSVSAISSSSASSRP
jgi:signal transduction histidine kinase